MGFDPKNFDNRVVLAENAIERRELAAALIEYRAAVAIKDDDSIRQKLDSFPKPGDYAYLFFNPKSNWEETAVSVHLESGKKCLEEKQFKFAVQDLEFVEALRPANLEAKKLLDSAREALLQEQAVSDKKMENKLQKTRD